MSTDWNPRYVAYAASQGRTPDDQLAHDRAEKPGAHMVPFILWIGARWADYRHAHRLGRLDPVTAAGHEAFDAWLDEASP